MKIEQRLDTPVTFLLNQAFGVVEVKFTDKFGDPVSFILDIESACILTEAMDNGPVIPKPKPWWKLW